MESQLKNNIVLKVNSDKKTTGNLQVTSTFSRFYAKGRMMIEEFLGNGGQLADLKKGMPAYDYIKNAKLVDENGHSLNLEEKFSYLGFERKPTRVSSALDEVKKRVDKFVAEGGDLSTLSKKDDLYKYIKGAHLKDENGKKMSLEEVFSKLGYERKARYVDDVKVALIDEIEDYLANGGSFHIARKSLPFYERLRTYRRSLETNGQKLSTEQTMKMLGYKSYSDVYFRFKDLEKLAKFRDKDGFVDSYRQDNAMKCFVNSAAETLQMPAPLVVMLIGGEKLNGCYVETEYFKYVKDELEKFIKINGKMTGISNKDPQLYSKILTIKKYVATTTGENISSKDVLELLDIDTVDCGLSSSVPPKKNIGQELFVLCEKTKNTGRKLTREDIPDKIYREVILNSVRLGITTKAFFNAYDIDYVDGRNVSRLNKVYMEKYPYIDEMKERKSQLMAGALTENGLCKEEVFEKTVEASLQVFKEFRDKIFNFEVSTINEIASNKDKAD